MNATNATPSVAKAVAAKPARVSGKTPGGADLGQDASREARRQAAAILEVLSGARTTAEAAAVLGVSLPRYYQIESRAVRGLLAACEAKPKGRQRTAASELTALRQQHVRLQRDLARQQALARMAQRTIGLAAPPLPKPAKSDRPGKTGKKPRRPKVARALSVAVRLQKDEKDDTVPATTPAATDTV